MLLNTELSPLEKLVTGKQDFILKKYNEGCKATLKHTYTYKCTTHTHTHTHTHKHMKTQTQQAGIS